MPYSRMGGFPGACNAGDLDSILGLGRPPGEGHGHPLQYSGLENPMDRGAWWAKVHRVANSGRQLSDLHSLTEQEDVFQLNAVLELVPKVQWFLPLPSGCGVWVPSPKTLVLRPLSQRMSPGMKGIQGSANPGCQSLPASPQPHFSQLSGDPPPRTLSAELEVDAASICAAGMRSCGLLSKASSCCGKL